VADKRPSLANVANRTAPVPAASETPKRVPAGGHRERSAPVYGKRANPSYTQMSATIPKELKARFKAAVTMADRDINSVIEELLEAYLQTRTGR